MNIFAFGKHYVRYNLKIVDILAIVLIGITILLWQDIKKRGKISYTTSISIILFIDGLCSFIVTLILLLFGKLYKDNSST